MEAKIKEPYRKDAICSQQKAREQLAGEKRRKNRSRDGDELYKFILVPFALVCLEDMDIPSKILWYPAHSLLEVISAVSSFPLYVRFLCHYRPVHLLEINSAVSSHPTPVAPVSRNEIKEFSLSH